MIGIYRIYHRESGKSYVGQSINIRRRINAHFGWSNAKTYIDNTIRKYGKDAFTWEVLELCSEDNLDSRECHWIAVLDCVSPNGYNLKEGGATGKFSEEVRKKMSKVRQGLKPSAESVRKRAESLRGHPTSDETREKISKALKGRVFTDESRRKMSDAKKGKPSPHRGKKHTDETRRKMSEAQKGKKVSLESRQKISKTNKERTFSDEWRRKISEGQKARWSRERESKKGV